MKWLILLLICLPTFAAVVEKDEVRDRGNAIARQIEAEINSGKLTALAKRTDWVLDAMVDRGISQLKRHGKKELADRLQGEWSFHFRGYLTIAVEKNDRDIGDHAPLIKWLADFYDILELVLGLDACKALHLSDIKTINFTLPVVFRPCSFPMDAVTITRKDELKNHMAGGAIYYGIVPVIVYWLLDIPCMLGTAGVGIFLCGPISSAGEWITYKWIAPKISDTLYDNMCK